MINQRVFGVPSGRIFSHLDGDTTPSPKINSATPENGSHLLEIAIVGLHVCVCNRCDRINPWP